MRKSLLELLGAVAFALTLSTAVSAVGYGRNQCQLRLGSAAQGRYRINGSQQSRESQLIARLASPEAYKDAGLEYPYGNKFRFQIESRADGESLT